MRHAPYIWVFIYLNSYHYWVSNSKKWWRKIDLYSHLTPPKRLALVCFHDMQKMSFWSNGLSIQIAPYSIMVLLTFSLFIVAAIFIVVIILTLLCNGQWSIANAWEEEDDEVVMINCRLENLDLDKYSGDVKETFELVDSL